METMDKNKVDEDGLVEKNYNNDDIEDSYFGGRLKFKTKIVWRNVIFFLIIHIIGFKSLYNVLVVESLKLNFVPFVYTYFLAFLAGEGVTLGTHRLWCHRSYKARRPLRILLMIFQTLAGQNCCHTWIREHRAHHKYSDTNGDPHNATRGLFYSHVGWLMMRKHPECKKKLKTIFMEDVEKDPVIMFQKRHFKKLFFLIGIVIPTALPMILWNENFLYALGYAFLARYVLLLNITWSVNSLAHFYGGKPYDKTIMASENPFVSFIGYGEGWHNYHHAFPWDYKASEFGRGLNLTRDLIEFFEKTGMAYDLKEATYDMVKKRMARTGNDAHNLKPLPKLEKHKPPTVDDEKEGW